MREIADACGVPLSLYVKTRAGFWRRPGRRHGRDRPFGGFQSLQQHQVRHRAQESRGRSLSDRVPQACRSSARHQRHWRGAGRSPPARFQTDRIHHRLRRAGSQAVPPPLDACAAKDYEKAERIRARSCRSKTCATNGGLRECCMPPSRWPASPRPGPSLRRYRNSQPNGSTACGLSPENCAAGTDRICTQPAATFSKLPLAAGAVAAVPAPPRPPRRKSTSTILQHQDRDGSKAAANDGPVPLPATDWPALGAGGVRPNASYDSMRAPRTASAARPAHPLRLSGERLPDAKDPVGAAGPRRRH